MTRGRYARTGCRLTAHFKKLGLSLTPRFNEVYVASTVLEPFQRFSSFELS